MEIEKKIREVKINRFILWNWKFFGRKFEFFNKNI